tara:strand:- start:297 stop:461 length:165 start_codon:yes stop_codon:yes gene_type:complete
MRVSYSVVSIYYKIDTLKRKRREQIPPLTLTKEILRKKHIITIVYRNLVVNIIS